MFWPLSKVGLFFPQTSGHPVFRQTTPTTVFLSCCDGTFQKSTVFATTVSAFDISTEKLPLI
jgi:hypothetical protein